MSQASSPKRQGWLSKLIPPHSAEPGVVRLGRRRIYILPNRSGLLFGITLILMLLGAINYQLALGHALVFLLASLGLISMLHAQRNLLGLEIQAQPGPSVHAGEPGSFRIQVSNPDGRPRSALEWQLERQAMPRRLDLQLKQDKGWVTLDMATHQRGWFAMPRLTLSSTYPLGWYRTWSHPWPHTRLLVYPAPSFTPLPPGGSFQGDSHAIVQEGHGDFSGLRERQPAETLRHVAWKAAAREQGQKPLLVKVFGEGRNEDLELAWTSTAGDDETRLSILTGWVLQAERQGLRYSLTLPSRTIPAASGAAHCQRCLQALALYPDNS